MASLSDTKPPESEEAKEDDDNQLYEKFFAGFVVKNLDTGESFHVDEIGSFLEKSKLLTFESASVSGWTVSIPELKEFAPKGLKPFVAYRIYITNPDPSLVGGRRTFSVFRRYSDFVKLDQAVSFMFMCCSVGLSFPLFLLSIYTHEHFPELHHNIILTCSHHLSVPLFSALVFVLFTNIFNFKKKKTVK